MPKLKIRKSISKRFKITKTGKITRRSIGNRHLARRKSQSRIRRLKKPMALKKTLNRKIKKMLGK